MAVIIHISDLQIPRIERGLLETLTVFINQAKPDLVLITGDITQRARSTAFKQAKSFLAGLKTDFLVVPGNHDIPFYRVHKRIFSRFASYQKYITRNLNPQMLREGIAIAGINTARASVLIGGRINAHQINKACTFFKESDNWFRIVATHHPLALPPHYKSGQVANGASLALRHWGACAVDLFLAGHYHVSTAMVKRIGRAENAYNSVFVQAGTLSERLRGEPVAFNIIKPAATTLKVENYHLTADSIYLAQEHFFQKDKTGWCRKIDR